MKPFPPPRPQLPQIGFSALCGAGGAPKLYPLLLHHNEIGVAGGVSSMLLVNRKIVRVVLLWIEGGEWNGFLQAEDKLASDPALCIQFSLVCR